MSIVGLKQVADNHPLFVAVSVFMLGVAVGGVPVGLYKTANEAETGNLVAEIDRLKAEIGAVTRSVGDDQTPELRTDEIVISAAEAQDLSPSLKYVEEDDLYAPGLANEGWSFTVTDEAGLGEMQGGNRTELETALGPVANQRVDLWRSADVVSLTDTTGATFSAFPFVAVERLERDVLFEWINEASGTNDLENFVADDPLGALFQLNVVSIVANSSPTVSAVLGGIQRAEDVLYCDITLILREVEVDGVATSRFYLRKELLFLDTGDDLVVITTNLPSQDRRSDEAVVVTKLLSGLRVVA